MNLEGLDFDAWQRERARESIARLAKRLARKHGWSAEQERAAFVAMQAAPMFVPGTRTLTVLSDVAREAVQG